MKDVLRLFAFSFLLTVISGSSISAQDSPGIRKIRRQFKSWQEVLNKETLGKAKRFFHIYSGENYQNEKWVTAINKQDSGAFIGEEVTLVKNDKLGIMFFISERTPTEDWYIAAEHYYWPSGGLFFVYWILNTHLALEPLTIERRLYFGEDGTLVESLESVYRLGTKEKIDNPSYMPQDVTYWKNVRELPFYNLLEKTP
jgi:hypothetical protein